MGAFAEAAHIPGAEHALQRPQNDHNKQHKEQNEEDHLLAVSHSVHHSEMALWKLGSSVHLGGPNVNADAEGRRTFRVP